MSQTLYRKYRPQKFSDITGQKHITRTIINAIKNNRVSHAYLFTGPRGTGKTSIARILASAINCQRNKNGEPCLECQSCKDIIESTSVDIFEIDAASHTGVDNIRELKETINIPPVRGKYKVYIIDEVHMLSQGAFNALLKTLEEPPKHVVFVLATTEIHKIPETILSRCQRFDFSKMSIENIIEKLSKIAESEKVKISKESLELIAIAAEGGMRDAESLLSQIMSLEDKNITTKEVEEIIGISKQSTIEEIVSSINQKDLTSIFTSINNLSKDGYDLEIFSKSLLNYLRKILIIKLSDTDSKSLEMTTEQFKKASDLSSKISSSELIMIIDNLLEAQGKIRSSFISQLPLEIAFAKSIQTSKESAQHTSTSASSQTKKYFTQQEKNEVSEIKKDITQKEGKKSDTSLYSTQKNNVSTSKKPESPKNTKGAKLINIGDITKNWERLRSEISNENMSLSSFLSTCRPSKVLEGNIVVICAKYDFHKEKLNETSNRLTIEEKLDKIVGSSVKIKVIVEQKNDSSTEKYYASLNRDETGEDTQSNGDLINNALNIFGGKIVEQ